MQLNLALGRRLRNVKTIRILQLVWAGLLFPLLFVDALSVELVAIWPLLALALVYVFACILALGSSRIGWLVAFGVPIIIFTRALLMVGSNVAAVARHDPLYIDSPATIYVVVIDALLFMLPSAVLIALFWRERAPLRGLLSAPRTDTA